MEPIEESWKNQELFVQDASHELRTPLTIIFSKIESIIKRPKNKVEDEMNNLVIVMKEVRRLSKLVSDLLKLTKEDAIITINKSKFDIVEMINDILKQYEDIFELQNKKLKVNYTLKDNNIYSDKEKLKQIFIIIIDNAMKYTKENDYIQVCLSEEGSNVKIEVKDSGIGIKEEEISLIFNRFYRASSHRETNKEGSGIGLSIAKLLVTNLKGEICVNSKYKKGSTFSIYIPKK
ncbi:sensor histidine kinase [Paeniclostridium hominis]|uniref:sensor histidine kinase n=1 Tax=Paeniclostridium hominis TaxID=2764329 RepID=UPI0022E18A15|nr:HAMP domain-containing sensor histidine kinase [Paeniclostridium hominis]